MNLYQHAKSQFISSIHFSFLTRLAISTTKNLNQLLIFLNFYQLAKDEDVSSISSGEIIDLKILQSDWLRPFWSLSQKQDFLKIWDLCKNKPNNINFHYRTYYSPKIKDQIVKFKKPCFWPISPIFGPKKGFSKYSALSHTTS